MNFVVAGRCLGTGNFAILENRINKCKNVYVYKNPEEIAPFLEGSLVAVAPSFWGGGTKIKILDAMKAGIPVVTTSREAAALGCLDGEEVFIADTKEEFLDKIQRLINDKNLRTRMAAAALKIVNDKYTNEAIFSKTKAKILEIAGVLY